MRIVTVPLSLHKLLRGQMRYMTEQGFEVLMVSADGPEIDAVVEHESCQHLKVAMTRKITPVQDVIALLQLCLAIKRFKPDIIHTHTPKAGLLGMLAGKIMRVPKRFHTVAGLPWMESSGLMRYLLKSMEHLTSWASTKMFVNSNALKAFMQAENIGVKQNKLFMLGKGSSNGIDLEYFSRNVVDNSIVSQLVEKSNLKSDGKVWLIISRVVVDKGIVEMVEAFERIMVQYPNDQLWIVGPEENKNALPVDVVKKIKVNESIIMWGYQEDVRPYFVAAHALVFPSYREGFPNVPLQAAAMECPLILSDINGCNELVQHEINGLLVPVKDPNAIYDAMIRMRSSEMLCRSFVKESLVKVHNDFSQKNIWKEIKEAYQRS